MTANFQKKRPRTSRVGVAVLTLLAVTVIGLFIKNSALAAECVRHALSSCVNTVIPAVFPCSVASGIFISVGGGNIVGRLLRAPMKFLFGASGSGACVLLIGWLCGFPTGAVTGAALARRGELGRDELERLILFSSIPSPAFVIFAVGEGMLGDRRLGIILWLALFISSVTVGLLIHAVSKRELCPAEPVPVGRGLIASVCDSLQSSAIAMLNLCAGVVFFSVLTRLLSDTLCGILYSPFLRAAFTGLFEISGGCAAAASLASPLSPALCGVILGWSGFCVHFQIISALGGMKRLFSYLLAKSVQGILCGFLVAAFTL